MVDTRRTRVINQISLKFHSNDGCTKNITFFLFPSATIPIHTSTVATNAAKEF